MLLILIYFSLRVICIDNNILFDLKKINETASQQQKWLIDGSCRQTRVSKRKELAVRSAFNAARFPKGFLIEILCDKLSMTKRSKIRKINVTDSVTHHA